MIKSMNKIVSNNNKKTCIECAYLERSFDGASVNRGNMWTCLSDNSSLQNDDLKIMICNGFSKKKEGMSLQQLKEIDDKRLSNQLKKHWKFT